MSALHVCICDGHCVEVSSVQDGCADFCVAMGDVLNTVSTVIGLSCLYCPRKQLQVAVAVPTAFWGQYNQINPTIDETVLSTSSR